MESQRQERKRKKNLDFSGNQRQPLSPTQRAHEPSEQQNLSTYTHYQNPHQPPQYAEGIIPHQNQPPKEPTLNQTIEHAKHTRGTIGMRSTGGEIVQVEGGHIVRSTGRKDRHSKVYTAKGPRDRRVRLSAHTAIEFYDVQDRLGYDRPSKAVDWLIKKAKPSIDKLAELPPWHPVPTETAQAQEEEHNAAGSSDMANNNNIAEQSESSGYSFHLQRQLGENHPDNHSPFIITPQPQPIETDPIAFFPTTSATSSINFQSYPPDIISRTNNPTQDLGLSLHSFQEASANQAPSTEHQGALFAGSTNVGFESHYQKIVTWNNEAPMDMNRVGFMVNSHQPFLGQGGAASAYSQSGALQSSFSPSLRSWSDIPMNSNASEHHHRSQQPIHQASIFGSRFLSDGLAGFCNIPARIQGEEENHGVASNSTPSSASPNSHH